MARVELDPPAYGVVERGLSKWNLESNDAGRAGAFEIGDAFT